MNDVLWLWWSEDSWGLVAQLGWAFGSHPKGRGFDSLRVHTAENRSVAAIRQGGFLVCSSMRRWRLFWLIWSRFKSGHSGIITYPFIAIFLIYALIFWTPASFIRSCSISTSSGLNFTYCTFVFSAFGYKISAVKYRIFVRFCQVILTMKKSYLSIKYVSWLPYISFNAV